MRASTRRRVSLRPSKVLMARAAMPFHGRGLSPGLQLSDPAPPQQGEPPSRFSRKHGKLPFGKPHIHEE
jgi:hypothetical protein